MCRTTPKATTGASRRKRFSFSPMSARFIHRCLSVATMAAIDLSITAAVCLVALRARSVVRRNSVTASGGAPDPGLGPFSRSAWYACNTDIVCKVSNQPDQLPRMPYHSSEMYPLMPWMVEAGAFSVDGTLLER